MSTEVIEFQGMLQLFRARMIRSVIYIYIYVSMNWNVSIFSLIKLPLSEALQMTICHIKLET